MAGCTPDLSNVNMLTPTGFRLTINAQEFRHVEYFCVAAQLPAVAVQHIDARKQNRVLRVPGESIEYDTLSVRFVVDEELKNYIELYRWLYTNARTDNLVWRDMTLSILTNKNTKNKQIHYRNAIPISISPLEFDAQVTDIEYLSAEVVFAFSEFEITPLDSPLIPSNTEEDGYSPY